MCLCMCAGIGVRYRGCAKCSEVLLLHPFLKNLQSHASEHVCVKAVRLSVCVSVPVCRYRSGVQRLRNVLRYAVADTLFVTICSAMCLSTCLCMCAGVTVRAETAQSVHQCCCWYPSLNNLLSHMSERVCVAAGTGVRCRGCAMCSEALLLVTWPA